MSEQQKDVCSLCNKAKVADRNVENTEVNLCRECSIKYSDWRDMLLADKVSPVMPTLSRFFLEEKIVISTLIQRLQILEYLLKHPDGISEDVLRGYFRDMCPNHLDVALGRLIKAGRIEKIPKGLRRK